MEGARAFRDGKLLLEGWEAVSGNLAEELEAEQFAQALELASLYRMAFTSSEAGRRVLEDLERTFLMQRVVRPGDDQFTVGIRQGQVDVVARILAMVEFANTGGGRPTGPGAAQQE